MTTTSTKTKAMLRLDEIRDDPRLQMRIRLDDGAVEDYRAVYAGEQPDDEGMPPLDVVHDIVKAAYWLVDGFHRLKAAQLAGLEMVAVVITEGDFTLAREMARKSNRKNGVRLTNLDKRRIVLTALEDHPQMSNRAIAKECGVSDVFVGKVRDESGANVCTSQRRGLDGKTYQVGAPGPVVEEVLARLQEAGLLPDPAVILEPVKALYGNLTVPWQHDEPEEPIDPSKAADAFLNAIRVEDNPPIYIARLPFTSAVPDAVLAAVEAFKANLRERDEVGVWELATVWWACQVALNPAVWEHIGELMSGWRARILDAVLYFLEHPEGAEGPPPVEAEESEYRYVYAADLRHARLLAPLRAVEFTPPPGQQALRDLIWQSMKGMGEKDYLMAPSSVAWRRVMDGEADKCSAAESPASTPLPAPAPTPTCEPWPESM
jgi:hypothetical protein